MKLIAVTTHLKPEQVEAIDRLAKERQVKKAVMFRMAVGMFLKEYDTKEEEQ